MNIYRKIIETFDKRYKLFLMIFITINLVFFVFSAFLKVNSDFKIFTLDRNRQSEYIYKLNEKFSSDDSLIYAVEIPGKPVLPGDLKLLYELQESIMKISGSSNVSGPAPGKVFINKKIKDFKELGENDLPYLNGYYESMGDLNPVCRYKGKYYAVFSVYLDKKADYKKINSSITGILNEKGLNYFISGEAYLKIKLFQYILVLSYVMPLIAFIFILFFFYYLLGSMTASILSMLPAIFGTSWLMGTMAMAGIEMNLSNSLAPLFILVLGCADGLHYVSHYIDEIKSGESNTDALIKTLESIGVPIILTTLTTIAGFVSLLIIKSSSIRMLVLLASVGMAYASIATWYFLPLFFLRSKKLKIRSFRKADLSVGLLKKLWNPHESSGRGNRGGRNFVIITVILLLIFTSGIFLIRNDFAFLSLFRKSSGFYRNYYHTSEITKGSIPLFIIAKTDINPLDAEVGRKIMEMEEELKERNLISKSISIYDFFSVIHNNRLGKDDKMYPLNKVEISFYYSMLHSDSPEFLKSMLIKEEKLSRILIFPAVFNNQTMNEIEKIVSKYNSGSLSLYTGGLQKDIKEMNDTLIQQQMSSILIALILVFAMLLISYRNLKVSLISLIPIVSSLVFLFGTMGFLRIPLNSFTVIMAGLVIGIGIDYSIHYSSIYIDFRKKYGAGRAAVKAYDYASKPILANAFGLAIGITAMVFSPMKMHLDFTVLNWIAMASSSVLSLTLLPIILKRLK